MSPDAINDPIFSPRWIELRLHDVGGRCRPPGSDPRRGHRQRRRPGADVRRFGRVRTSSPTSSRRMARSSCSSVTAVMPATKSTARQGYRLGRRTGKRRRPRHPDRSGDAVARPTVLSAEFSPDGTQVLAYLQLQIDRPGCSRPTVRAAREVDWDPQGAHHLAAPRSLSGISNGAGGLGAARAATRRNGLGRS